jgi:hypothetical protein
VATPHVWLGKDIDDPPRMASWLNDLETWSTNVANIQAFGADPTGVADSTDSIKRAILSLGTVYPGTLFIPPGLFKISSTITLPSVEGGMVVGTGRGSIIVAANGTNADILTCPSDRWTFQNFAIHGNSSNNSTGAGLTLGGKWCWIDSLYIANTKGNGITQNGSYSWFDKVYVTDAQSNSILIAGVGSNRITNVESLGAQGKGINVQANSFDNELIGCLVGSSVGDNFYVGTSAGPTRLTNCHGYSSATANGLFVDGATLVHVVNCDFESNNQRGVSFSTAKGCGLVGGRLWNNGLQGVFLFGMNDCSIVGVTIYNNGQGSINAGISGSGSLDISVTGCDIYDTQGGSKTQTYAIETTGSSDRWMIHGNSIRAAAHRTGSTLLVGAGNLPATLGNHNSV